MANEKSFKDILDEVINATKENKNPADLLNEDEQKLLNDVNELLDKFDEKTKSLNARPNAVNREQWLARQIEKNVSRISNDEARQKIIQVINDSLPEVNDDYIKEEEDLS